MHLYSQLVTICNNTGESGRGGLGIKCLSKIIRVSQIFEDLVKRILTNQTEELSHQTIDAYLGSESDDDGDCFRIFVKLIFHDFFPENVTARYATADKKCCSA
jgi:hypothetical protein